MHDDEMQIRAASVEFFCRDLEDGYQHKKSVVQPNNVEERIHLAQWCEQRGLLIHATEELDAAEKIDDKHPMITILRNHLKVLVAVKKETPMHPGTTVKLPGDEELDQMIRGMPPGAVQQYVSVVQPILLNLCPGAGGSTPGMSPTGRLQLLRPPYGESPNRRITQRNLFAVLQFVNWDEPGASPLLAGIIGGEASVTVRHSEQYRRVKEWVYQITQKPMPSGEALAGETEIPSIPEMAQQMPRPKRTKTHTAPRNVRSIVPIQTTTKTAKTPSPAPQCPKARPRLCAPLPSKLMVRRHKQRPASILLTRPSSTSKRPPRAMFSSRTHCPRPRQRCSVIDSRADPTNHWRIQRKTLTSKSSPKFIVRFTPGSAAASHRFLIVKFVTRSPSFMAPKPLQVRRLKDSSITLQPAALIPIRIVAMVETAKQVAAQFRLLLRTREIVTNFAMVQRGYQVRCCRNGIARRRCVVCGTILPLYEPESPRTNSFSIKLQR